MSKIEVVSKKTKKIIPAVVAGDNGYEDVNEWKGLTTEKAAKNRFKALIKKGQAYTFVQNDSSIIVFAVEDNLKVDGTYHIAYWKTDSMGSYNNALNMLIATLAEKEIKDIVIFFNSNDVETRDKFNGKDKAMIFQDQIYISNSLDASGNDEWEAANIGTVEEMFKVEEEIESYKEYNESKETETIPVKDQEETISVEETPVAEEIAEESVVEEQPTDSFGEQPEVYSEEVYAEPTPVDQEEVLTENNVEEVVAEEPKSDHNWAEEFFKLKGDHANGILSNEERFSPQGKVKNAYAKIDDPKTMKNSIDSLEELRRASDRVGEPVEDSYEATRKMVLENLKRLSASNKANKEAADKAFSEDKNSNELCDRVTADDLLNKIIEMKEKISNK